MDEPADFGAGRPVVLRGGTVLAMDDARSVIPHADVLVIGDTIAAAGPGWRCRTAPSRSTREAAS